MNDYDHTQYSLKEADTDTDFNKTLQKTLTHLNELNCHLMLIKNHLENLELKLQKNKPTNNLS